MTHTAKPYSLRLVLAVGLALAVVFLAMSLFFLYLQAKNSDMRLAGEIIAITGDTITIRSARGDETDLLITPETRLFDIDAGAGLAPGEHIMTRGDLNDAGVFEAGGIRRIKPPPASPE